MGGSTGNRLIVSDHNTGNSLWGWNTLIEQASGDYLFLLSADDELLPGAIEAVAECAETRGGDWIYGDLEVIDGSGRTIDMWEYAQIPQEAYQALQMILQQQRLVVPFIGAWRLDWLREHHLHCIPFPDMGEAVDCATGIHWLMHNPQLRRIPYPIARYRRHPGQETDRIDRQLLGMQIVKLYEQLRG